MIFYFLEGGGGIEIFCFESLWVEYGRMVKEDIGILKSLVCLIIC